MSREGTQGMDRTGTGHTGHAQGHSGVQAGLVQGVGAPSWQLPPVLRQDVMARLAHSPPVPLLCPGLSSGLPSPQGSTLGHTPTLTVWGNRDQEETHEASALA